MVYDTASITKDSYTIIQPSNIVQRDSFDITFAVLTYNPVIESLIFTLESLVKQKNVSFEILVSDDGSKNNLSSKTIEYFESKGFQDYKYILHYKNRGTVWNSYDAIIEARGEYIKLIGPGDAILSEDTISNWLNCLKETNRNWSFGDAIFYKHDENHCISVIKHEAYPHAVGCYKRENNNECRWNYIVFGDYVLGAATLCERNLILEYTRKILNRVIYGEDCYYWMMMFNDIMPYYYPQNVILYETGNGISTDENPLHGKLLEDWDTIVQMTLNEQTDYDDFQNKLKKAYYAKDYPNCKYIRWMKKILMPLLEI